MNETPRVLRVNRAQLELRPTDLESLLPEDHRARAIWQFVEGLDLSGLYAEIRSVEGHAGRPAIDPAILLALWVYATSEGVGSARHSRGCASGTTRTAGSAAAWRCRRTGCRTSGWRTGRRSTSCSRRA